MPFEPFSPAHHQFTQGAQGPRIFDDRDLGPRRLHLLRVALGLSNSLRPFCPGHGRKGSAQTAAMSQRCTGIARLQGFHLFFCGGFGWFKVYRSVFAHNASFAGSGSDCCLNCFTDAPSQLWNTRRHCLQHKTYRILKRPGRQRVLHPT